MDNKYLPKMDNSIKFGILLIIMGFIILVTDFIDVFVTTLLWPLLEGSSEGKTVLFLGILGSLFILSSLLRQNKALTSKLKINRENSSRYLLITIILLFICAFVGLVIEYHIRSQFGVSFFTILTSMNPSASTTSPMHSHVYKSILGYLANLFVPTHINTGSSIQNFALPYALIIVVFWPISYLTGLFALTDMKPLHKFASIFMLSVALIGLLDGGIFSQPFLIGIGFLLLIYFSDGKVSFKYLINPIVIMGYVVLIAMIIEVGGSDTDCHTLTVINQTSDVDMSMYDVTSIEVDGDKTIYTLNTTIPDKILITDIFDKFKGKCDATFMSWNFYSYFDNPYAKWHNHT